MYYLILMNEGLIILCINVMLIYSFLYIFYFFVLHANHSPPSSPFPPFHLLLEDPASAAFTFNLGTLVLVQFTAFSLFDS